jgi:hypothetical protein
MKLGAALAIATALIGIGLLASAVGILLRRKWGFYVYVPSILGLLVCIAVWSDVCFEVPLMFLVFLLPVLPVVGLLRDRGSSD